MSNTFEGKILGVSEKTYEWGKNVSLKVMFDGAPSFFSAIVGDKKLDQETKENLESVKSGDRVEITWYQKGQYKNISKLVKVQGTDESPDVQPSGREKQDGGNRDKLMRQSYAKDATNAIFGKVYAESGDPNVDVVDAWIAIYDKIYAHLSGE